MIFSLLMQAVKCFTVCDFFSVRSNRQDCILTTFHRVSSLERNKWSTIIRETSAEGYSDLDESGLFRNDDSQNSNQTAKPTTYTTKMRESSFLYSELEHIDNLGEGELDSVISEDNSNEADIFEDLYWRIEKLRLEEQNTKRFLKSKPRFLPYDECRKWVQAFGRRWISEEEWKDWINMGEKKNPYIPVCILISNRQ